MKKLTITSILLLIFINNFSQIVSFTYAPQYNDIGLSYISSEIKGPNLPLSFYLSSEYGNYKLIKTKIFRLSCGSSFEIHPKIYFNTTILLNFFKDSGIRYYPGTYVIPFKPLSSELGFTFIISGDFYTSMMTDFIYQGIFHNGNVNPYYKFGLGYKFK